MACPPINLHELLVGEDFGGRWRYNGFVSESTGYDSNPNNISQFVETPTVLPPGIPSIGVYQPLGQQFVLDFAGTDPGFYSFSYRHGGCVPPPVTHTVLQVINTANTGTAITPNHEECVPGFGSNPTYDLNLSLDGSQDAGGFWYFFPSNPGSEASINFSAAFETITVNSATPTGTWRFAYVIQGAPPAAGFIFAPPSCTTCDKFTVVRVIINQIPVRGVSTPKSVCVDTV